MADAKLCLVILALALTSCAMQRQCPCPETSYLKGYRTTCDGTLHIGEFNQTTLSTRLSLIPGQQILKIEYRSPTFYSNEPQTGPGELCVDLVEYKLSFESKAGRTYTFYVDGQPYSPRALTVLESKEFRGVESEPIDAVVNFTHKQRVCNLRFYEINCPDGEISSIWR